MKFNRKRIESDTEDAVTRMSGGKMIFLKDGQEVIGRFLPLTKPADPDEDESELYVMIGQHYFKELDLYVTCLNEGDVKSAVRADDPETKAVPFAGQCHIDDVTDELRASKNANDQEAAKAIRKGIRYISNFKKKDEDEVKMFAYGPKTLPSITDLYCGEEYADILELKNGRDVRIARKGTGLSTDYLVQPVKTTYTIPASILDQLNDVFAEVKIHTPKQMKLIFQGKADEIGDVYSLRDYINGDVDETGTKIEKKVAPTKGRGAATAVVSRRKPEPAEEAPASVVRRRKPAEPEPAEDAIDKTERATIDDICELIGIEIDFDNDPAAIREAIVAEVIGGSVAVRKLSEAATTWLDEHGADVSGKLVTKKAPALADDDAADVRGQIEAVRRARAKK